MNINQLKEHEREWIDELLSRSGIRTQVDLINEALTLYDSLLRGIEEGGSLPTQETPSGKIKELVVPSFITAQKRKRADEKPSKKTGT